MAKKHITIFRLASLMFLHQKVSIETNGKKEEVKIEYSGGSNSGDNLVGGRYISSDENITEAIKNSERFKNKQIVIENEYDEEVADETKTIGTPKSGTFPTPSNPELTSENIQNQQQAREFMLSKGVTAEDLAKASSAADLVILAKEREFSFPKWSAFNA